MPQLANSVIRQLRVVFSVSTVLLLISLMASFYSIRQLINNSQLVNHTNQVLLESENIISYMKDAETGQRGYLLTLNRTFLQPYTGSYDKVQTSYEELRTLTRDNEVQQQALTDIKSLYDAKFAQMRRIIELTERNPYFGRDTLSRNKEMIRGKQIMDDLRLKINRMKTEEQGLLKHRGGR